MANSRQDNHTGVLVLGAGPGGYTAAFRAADLGQQVTLVERYPTLGGVCLNVGCIPSKAMLHIARVVREVEELKAAGMLRGDIKPRATEVRKWTEGIIGTLTRGLRAMAKQRGVDLIQGEGRFISANQVQIDGAAGQQTLRFDHAIIAAGSQALKLPGLPAATATDPRILDSTSALLIDTVPKHMLVAGGGIIGLEMATVYAALGSRITIVELQGELIAGCDPDIVRPLHKHLARQYENIHLNTAITEVKANKRTLRVRFKGKAAPESAEFDALLVAVGRRPNGHQLGAANAGVRVSEQGFIPVDDRQRSDVPHIFAIGDITGPPMLAHKATHEGKVAAEVIAGVKSSFDDRVVPAVAYTDPELAWVGLTETEARARGIAHGTGSFPWAASGRSLAMGRNEGLTKLLFDEQSGRILGMAAVGSNASELIAEGALAIEMGCDAEDIGLTIHPHPTLSETVALSAEAFAGTITDLYVPRKKGAQG